MKERELVDMCTKLNATYVKCIPTDIFYKLSHLIIDLDGFVCDVGFYIDDGKLRFVVGILQPHVTPDKLNISELTDKLDYKIFSTLTESNKAKLNRNISVRNILM